MPLVLDVRVGDSVEMEHVEHGRFGSVRVDHKEGRRVRLVFDVPRAVIVRLMNHREHGITWGLSAEPSAPLKLAAV